MAGCEPVGDIHWRSNSGSGDEDGLEFIRCVDGRDPQVHEVWIFGEDGVTPEIYLTALVDVGDVIVGKFLIN